MTIRVDILVIAAYIIAAIHAVRYGIKLDICLFLNVLIFQACYAVDALIAVFFVIFQYKSRWFFSLNLLDNK